MKRRLELLTGGLTGALRAPAAGVFPLINLSEDKDGYVLRAELPGIQAEDIEISLTGNTLSMSGERKGTDGKADARFHRRERDYGRFSRVLTLPGPVEAAKVEARAANGILTIVIPKAESAKPRQIAIKSA